MVMYLPIEKDLVIEDAEVVHNSSAAGEDAEIKIRASRAERASGGADRGPGTTSISSAMDAAPSSARGAARRPVDPEQAIVLLRTLPLLQQLPEDSLPKIAAVLKTVHYGPGEPIVQINHEGEGLYIIWKGEVKVASPPRENATGHVVSTMRSGDYFGLATPGPARELYRADVIAITEVTCLLLTHDYADMLSGASIWNWPKQSVEGEQALLERILLLEKVEDNVFRTNLPQLYRNPRKNPNIFGGQSIAQALHAACRTVKPGYAVHSLHSYFLRTGKEDVETFYEVQRTRDGMSFATRHVQALQLGRVTFVLYASFKRPEDSQAYEHNTNPVPSTPNPEEVAMDEVVYDTFLTDPRLPLSVKQKYAGIKLPVSPLEIRLCDAGDKFQRVKMQPRQRVWFKTRGKLSDDPIVHWCALAYASDMHLLETSLRCHPDYLRSRMQILSLDHSPRMQVLSLDHSMWFHRPFKADDWLLYEMEAPWAGDARGLCFGRIYQNGELVVTVSQEGMIRKIEDKMQKAARL
ncbi:hypothetical protein MPTK1_6g09640 [Marchantia polymorpha subsp. ruderalis]|uniref:Cyclic nucleotide-binding domain-containing protein n=2 Tax=Marchantia polymorpha TaxID=3197 RepID=A0AAF6BQA5_MARPO|nr:hypothetical protein MARPO_0016s0008 [Marchantia polymorpha]BBN14189.1 hypothetical protein Mp_6g09640 [Marchantia polymorpha subsp. ruderalis]|eukprot:PTQ44924.1 hypothetical protein MARPO_0016s0008 [Marchantia polymorpha]